MVSDFQVDIQVAGFLLLLFHNDPRKSILESLAYGRHLKPEMGYAKR